METQSRMKITSAQLIPAGFLCMILVGAFLLMLPVSTVAGETTTFLTALFTSTTSVCVTGLVVVDTFSHWTLMGKVVILILIQLGGLGIIAVSSSVLLMLHKKFSLKDRLLIHDAFNLNSMQGLVRFLSKVFKGTFMVEGLGALLYMFAFIPQFGVKQGLWISVFNSISAFCNAGIDIIGPSSLMSYSQNVLVMVTTMFLIVFGGLGYVVWFDLYTTFNMAIIHGDGLKSTIKRLNAHTKLVINVTITLILVGGLLTFLFERKNPATIGNMSFGYKILNSIFQSITYRTAGFASIPQDQLTGASCLMGCVWMFIGGSPVGTAGGVKTVTVFVILLNAVSVIRNRDEAVVFGRRVSGDMIQKASAIVTVSFLVTIVMTLALMLTTGANPIDSMYEIFSATATVGLSRGLTPELNSIGRIIVIVSMYLGRIGPISMALFFHTGAGNRKNKVSYAEGKFIIG